MVWYNPKHYGLPKDIPNADVPKVPGLPPRKPAWLTPFVQDMMAKAWKARDAALATSDGDEILADRVYQAVINQERRKHEKHSQHRHAGKPVDQLPRDAPQREGRSEEDRD